MTNDDLYEDEVMRECRERKAQVIRDYGGWEGYSRHLREDPPPLRPDGLPWPVANPGNFVKI
jgi:hypothetical protein